MKHQTEGSNDAKSNGCEMYFRIRGFQLPECRNIRISSNFSTFYFFSSTENVAPPNVILMEIICTILHLVEKNQDVSVSHERLQSAIIYI